MEGEIFCYSRSQNYNNKQAEEAMDTAWIQVFVLTLSECVAPAGKTVCQEQTLELQFLTQADCEVALQQLVSLKQESESVIIDPGNASCAPTARQQEVYVSLAAIEEANRDKGNWRAPEVEDTGPGVAVASHQERLARLPECGEEGAEAPCKVGEIIIEAGDVEPVDVWRRE
jgi:hypothetical protein